MKRTTSYAIQIVTLAVLITGALNYQSIMDQYALLTFHPTAAVAAIEGRLELTPKAKAIFASAKPVIDSKVQFNADCSTTKGELELGCFYHGRIYVLQIDNQSLAPEMDVVMAHELLHAAWARLGQSSRAKLGNELETTYHALNNSDLNDRMAAYARSEPGEETNELHSILGTEDAQLSIDLTDYYQRYFINRMMIVAAHAQYEAVFTNERARLASQLAVIQQLKNQLQMVNARLDSDRSANDISAYNSLVPSQNQLVDTINANISIYQSGVNDYNALSASLNSQQITTTETNVQ